MSTAWPVPRQFAEVDDDPARADFAARLPELAADLAQRWGLVRDGVPSAGHLAVAWPVRTTDGGRRVLKISQPVPEPLLEHEFLHRAASPAVAKVHDWDDDLHALLIEQLDPLRSLASFPDVDQASRIIAGIWRGWNTLPANEFRDLGDELARIEAEIGSRERTGLPSHRIDRARATLREAGEDLRTHPELRRLVHGDCHYLNVLHTLPDESPRWVAIDPQPWSGFAEWEVIPVLRNRFDDAAATGNPDRALRRRLEILCETAGLDLDRAAALTQAVAVDNVGWLRGIPTGRSHPFLDPYLVLSAWE